MNQLAIADIPVSEVAPEFEGPSRWHADLELQFELVERGCRLARNRHSGPLYVQKPFYPEGRDLAHVYLLHPPGGLVSGDRLDIRVRVDAGARALVTTTGAGRVYRARSDGLLQSQNTVLQVAAGASLEWLPLENIAYPGANGAMYTRVDLARGAHFAGWEITSLGLPARDETFASGRLQQRLEIFREGIPLLVESLCVDGCALSPANSPILSAGAGLQRLPVNGLFVLGPFERAPETELLEQCREQMAAHDKHGLAGITLVSEMLVVRALGRCAFEVRALFGELWELLRPALLQREACAPRIWRT
ncbi:urease accessory protein UreD [Microbulbifer bruguierae]|uniref:Urease accessory protein UreD n=1 Tax=Microbulbifer bruguierae TaxID=3029061 RepID=A0ABY8NE57_9GAMM|nr:urease accessory protein UreD [Microbulbifer bruguierae]WGL16037.1 urease accessory protein UreD [Microbulbifer bruguierae]